MTVAAVASADTAAVANERGDGVVKVHTFIDSDEGGTANHKECLVLLLKPNEILHSDLQYKQKSSSISLTLKTFK